MEDLDKMFIIKPYLGKPRPMMIVQKDEELFTAIDDCCNTVRGPLNLIIRPATIEDCAKEFIINCKHTALKYDF